MPERVIAVTSETRRRPLLRDLKYGGLWFLAIWLRMPRLSGHVGEMRVHNCLLKGLPEGSLILSDVMLPTPRGTAQVDMVAVVGQRVFSIEVKNRAGRISGRERDRMWEWQVGPRGGTLYNPVSQSRRHARYLGQILGRTVEFMVVFAGSARVDSDAPCVFDTPKRLVTAILEACPGELGPMIWQSSPRHLLSSWKPSDCKGPRRKIGNTFSTSGKLRQRRNAGPKNGTDARGTSSWKTGFCLNSDFHCKTALACPCGIPYSAQRDFVPNRQGKAQARQDGPMDLRVTGTCCGVLCASRPEC